MFLHFRKKIHPPFCIMFCRKWCNASLCLGNAEVVDEAAVVCWV